MRQILLSSAASLQFPLDTSFPAILQISLHPVCGLLWMRPHLHLPEILHNLPQWR